MQLFIYEIIKYFNLDTVVWYLNTFVELMAGCTSQATILKIIVPWEIRQKC